jgi:Tol biopolymer transport system component
MPLSTGRRLGPYEIVSPLGAGGMGEVYKARDTRLARDVAVKVLPTELSADADRLRRFEQEARAAAALDHPGVLAVYDVGAEGGTSYLVTELLQGETLREALERGPFDLQRTLAVARQVLEALAAAHDQGIVHRDLKPENLFLTRRGQAKILDFGLAKLTEAHGTDLANAPTVAGATQTGVVVGTAGYMAPEQVLGAAVDRRADLFALGAVLYEVLTGQRAFARASTVDTLHAILHDEPRAAAAALASAPALDSVLRRALAKAPAERFQSARDFLFAFELAASPTGAPIDATGEGARPQGASRRFIAGVAALGLALALGAAWLASRSSERTPEPIASFAVGTLTPLTTDPGYEGEASFLPDGETLAYVSDRSGDFDIYLQQVSGGAAINLTRDPGDDVQPAVSPDGRSIAFVSSRTSRQALIYASPRLAMTGGDVWVMPTLGGLARKVAENGNFPSWSPDGSTIYFLRGVWLGTEVRRVAATGGESERIPLEIEYAPHLIGLRASPDGRRLAVQAGDAIVTVPVEGGRAIRAAIGRGPAWEPDGRALLFCNGEPGRNWALWRQRLDGDGRPVGPVEPVLTGAAPLASPDVARTGRRLAVAAVERASNLEELPFDVEAGRVLGPPRALTAGGLNIAFASLSPDGRSVVYDDTRGATAHLWRLDFDSQPVQVTSDPAYAEGFPRWSPDGSLIAFSRRAASEPRRPAGGEVWVMRPDGGNPRRVAPHGGNMAWMPDSRRLLVVHEDEYKFVEVATGAETKIELHGPSPMPITAISPDGEWLAYQTRADKGDVDLVVAPLPSGTARVLRLSERQDFHPSFDGTGRWLYFQIDHKNLWRIPGPAQGWRPALPEQMTHFPESGLFLEEPQLSPDGRRLIYSRVTTKADLWIVETAVPARAGG